jgi:4-amino-4-deoxy-L-arabinose transferase-like glycosyltransferase
MRAGRDRRLRRFIAVLAVVYCAKQVLCAVVFPPFTGHDEIAHYEYIRIVALEGRVPTLSTDRLPGRLFEYKRYALQWRELGQWTTPLYTALHPPLYYAAMVPVYRAGRDLSPVGKQYLLRFAAIPFGLITVLLAYGLARTFAPADEFLAVTVPTVVAFQPQISYEAAMVNNDIVAIALFSWVLHLLVLIVRDGLTPARAALTGLAFGLALLAKSTAATALPIIVLGFWLAARAAPWRRIAGMLAITGGIALLLAAPWYAFMYRTYGDFTGLAQLSAIQTDLAHSKMTFPQLLFSGEFAMMRWKETWGEFGWKLISIPGWIISATALMAIVSAGGMVVYVIARSLGGRTSRDSSLEDWQRNALLVLAAACVVAYMAVLQFGTVFVLAQARYYFPAVNAAALLAMLGVRALVPVGHRTAAQVLLVGASIGMNLIIYTAHVVPYWYFRP